MAEKSGFDPSTGAWNDSLAGDFLWSRNNFGEARPDVMSPLTYSITEMVWQGVSPLPGYQLSGNICGRYYANVSVSIAMLRATGKSEKAALEQMRGLLGSVPEGLDIPVPSLPRSTILRAMPKLIGLARKEKAGAAKVPSFLASNVARCRDLSRRILEARSEAELAAIWNRELASQMVEGMWVMGGAAAPLEATMPLKQQLVELVGEADANALCSGLSAEGEILASLGPVTGLARVAQGKMTRAEYLEKYGHRGPWEMELSLPRPAEDPTWLDRQLVEYEKDPVDVDALLKSRGAQFEAAWQRLQERYPNRAGDLKRKIDKVGPAARTREAVRDEVTRALGVSREWALRVGELTGVGHDVFLLTIAEALDLLSGKDTVSAYVPARRETYAAYRKLPVYPMIIRGAFDPFRWAGDPKRRSDVFDATASVPAFASNLLTGFAGAAGVVEGPVRVLDTPDQAGELKPGEILVAVTTNVGWTPLFPMAAAVITDVGAPLSHAAIVARELGIPAVVGCGSATTRLRTGDRVRVDGGRGIVEILHGSRAL